MNVQFLMYLQKIGVVYSKTHEKELALDKTYIINVKWRIFFEVIRSS